MTQVVSDSTATAFSWGYWGWGNATTRFAHVVDAVERERGFLPPLFVDIRFSRSVRARGFNGRAFEVLVGADRYRWIKALGNRAIASPGTDGIEIADPAAAEDLLDLVLEEHPRRRIIFFCACSWPLSPEGPCHRSEVTALLLSAAAKRRQQLGVVEWPGGVPVEKRLRVTAELLQQVARGRKSIRLAAASPFPTRALPWGSVVALTDGSRTLRVVTGPACFSDGWYLPVLASPRAGAAGAAAEGSRFRREHGLDEQWTSPEARRRDGASP